MKRQLLSLLVASTLGLTGALSAWPAATAHASPTVSSPADHGTYDRDDRDRDRRRGDDDDRRHRDDDRRRRGDRDDGCSGLIVVCI